MFYNQYKSEIRSCIVVLKSLLIIRILTVNKSKINVKRTVCKIVNCFRRI